ncbi:hypothetical protein [Pseudonocardia sp. ICBG1034]|uniref:hypothetical protein n=1 Tax=Pseudonocardia sp. ICBG1034 TaxID=2844381 RepID=UPI001CCDDDAA|nr:hypothetical protein [Pseudonocardia sp. ICBG1034]
MSPRPRTLPSSRAAVEVRCSACGRQATTADEVADLATEWLMPDPAGRGPASRRFCRGCAPDGPVDEVVCARCGDGPLLAGELTNLDLEVTAAIDAWLVETGWRLAGPVCPGCVVDMSR